MLRDEDFEEPSWFAILARPALQIDELTSTELRTELAIRVPALLDAYGGDRTTSGVLTAFINLAIAHHPAFQFKERKRLPVSGRPISDRRWFWRQVVLGRVRKLEAKARRNGSPDRYLNAEAARQIHKEYFAKENSARVRLRGHNTTHILVTPSAKTLQNYLLQKIAFPKSLRENDNRFHAQCTAQNIAREILQSGLPRGAG
jgi:hypothetical protein